MFDFIFLNLTGNEFTNFTWGLLGISIMLMLIFGYHYIQNNSLRFKYFVLSFVIQFLYIAASFYPIDLRKEALTVKHESIKILGYHSGVAFEESIISNQVFFDDLDIDKNNNSILILMKHDYLNNTEPTLHQYMLAADKYLDDINAYLKSGLKKPYNP